MLAVHNPLICALDTTDMQRVKALCTALSGQVGAIKLGLEFFTAHGKAGVREITAASGLPLFLDLKFHDIPNTVAKAVQAACDLKPLLMTVHAGGGKTMLKAAVQAAKEASNGNRPRLLGVTVLTSMDEQDLGEVGVQGAVQDHVRRLAHLTQETGLDGVICSPHEIALLRKECGEDFLLVVPGIRPEGAEKGDQKRVLTPREALNLGANYLVIGRPITEAADPRAIAAQIVAHEISHA